MAALFQRTALPQPDIIGGAVSTRRQLKGLRAEADVAASIAKYVNKTHGGKGKVSQRTAIAIHKFAGLWGELTKRKIQVQQQLEALLDQIRLRRSGRAHSREVQGLQGQVRQLRRQHQGESSKLARLDRWFDKNVKRKMKSGGEALAEVLRQAMAASQSFVDVLKTLSPAGLFSAMWSKVSRWWNGPSAATAAARAAAGARRRSGRGTRYQGGFAGMAGGGEDDDDQDQKEEDCQDCGDGTCGHNDCHTCNGSDCEH